MERDRRLGLCTHYTVASPSLQSFSLSAWTRWFLFHGRRQQWMWSFFLTDRWGSFSRGSRDGWYPKLLPLGTVTWKRQTRLKLTFGNGKYYILALIKMRELWLNYPFLLMEKYSNLCCEFVIPIRKKTFLV